MRNLIAMLVAMVVAFAPMSVAAENFIIGMPGDFQGNREDLEKLVSKAFTSIHSGDTLSVYDAANRKRLMLMSLPSDSAYDNMRLRTKQFGGYLRPLGSAFDKMMSAEAKTSPSNIGLPAFLREIANSAVPTLPGNTAELLVLGSAKFDDPREKAFSMLNGHFPSDGHLRVDDNVSPFGVANRAGALRGVSVHFCLTDTDWIDELHRQRVERFWALYIGQMGGVLASFTADLNTCAQRFLEKKTDMPERYALDPRQTKPEMLRITREVTPEVAMAEELPIATATFEQGGRFMDDGITLSDTPPTSMTGQAKIGIRWACATCDLDIYSRANPSLPFLYFRNQISQEGRHNKDWRNSPDAEKQFEYIDFNGQIDLNQLEVYVHFYAGSFPGGAPGVVRLWFNGQVYEASFHIEATRGNSGDTSRPDLVADKPEWVKINVMELIKLSPVASR